MSYDEKTELFACDRCNEILASGRDMVRFPIEKAVRGSSAYHGKVLHICLRCAHKVLGIGQEPAGSSWDAYEGPTGVPMTAGDLADPKPKEPEKICHICDGCGAVILPDGTHWRHEPGDGGFHVYTCLKCYQKHGLSMTKRTPEVGLSLAEIQFRVTVNRGLHEIHTMVDKLQEIVNGSRSQANINEKGKPR